jgi:hypothetical protein
MSVFGKSFRFSDVVYAIGIAATPAVLRNWLAREQIALMSERPAGTWRIFDVGDVAVLAVTRRLVDAGLDVASANKIALAITPPFLQQYKQNPKQQKIPDRRLAVWRDDGSWERGLYSLDSQEFRDKDMFITINIFEVIRVALEKLDEISNEDEE